MDRDILKIDLDIKEEDLAIEELNSRLWYICGLGFFNLDRIKKIELIKKTNHSVRIFIDKELDVKTLVLFQLILGSDYRKEVNTLMNYYFYNMKYFNRLFDIKRYRDGTFKKAKIKDITELVKKEVIKRLKKKKVRN